MDARKFATFLAFALLSGTAAATAKIIDLPFGRGGNLEDNLKQAEGWLKDKLDVHITGHQTSSSAFRVIYYKHLGGNICYQPGVKLYLHQPSLGGEPFALYREMLRYRLGVDLGELSWRRYKTVAPSAYDIPACTPDAEKPSLWNSAKQLWNRLLQ